MTRIKAISIDDEASAHEALCALLLNVPDVEIVTTCTSPVRALSVLRADRYELLFLDIAMPEISGLDLLRALDNPPVTVLMTAHVEHALAAFELGVRDYLLKPVSAQRLSRCLEHIRPLLFAARTECAIRTPERLAIKCGGVYQLIDPARTVRIAGAGNFSTVYGEHDELFASESMKELERRLAPCGFLRIHKSHLVNMRCVRAVSAAEVRLENGLVLPIGRAYRPVLVDALREAHSVFQD
jgi:two-component system LytT family response regulator